MRIEMLHSFRNRALNIGILGLLGVGISIAANPKLSAELEGVDGRKPVDVIITFKQAPTFSDHAKVQIGRASCRERV